MQDYSESHWSLFILELGKLDRANLEDRFSNQNLVSAVLDSIPEIDENMGCPETVSRHDFPDLLYKLYQIVRYWGRRITAEELEVVDTGDVGILHRFIQDCPSPYYRKEAEDQLQYWIRKR